MMGTTWERKGAWVGIVRHGRESQLNVKEGRKAVVMARRRRDARVPES